MITRNLTNLGEEFTSFLNGNLSFLLVSEGDRSPSVYDTTTLEPIHIDQSEVSIDGTGLFTVPLWPNERGNIPTFYLVTLTLNEVKRASYKIQIPDGVGDISWSAVQTVDLSPSALSLLTASQVVVDTANFIKNLGVADTDVQKALETLDALIAAGGVPLYAGDPGAPNTDDVWINTVSGQLKAKTASGTIVFEALAFVAD